MKAFHNIFLIFILIINYSFLKSQNNPEYQDIQDTISKESNEQFFLVVEQMPDFLGGMKELYKWLFEHIEYPEEALKNNVEGKVFIGFIVEADGSIMNVAVKRGLGAGCDEEAVRVVENMPNWLPGMQNGNKVRVAYTLPVVFMLDHESKKKQKDK